MRLVSPKTTSKVEHLHRVVHGLFSAGEFVVHCCSIGHLPPRRGLVGGKLVYLIVRRGDRTGHFELKSAYDSAYGGKISNFVPIAEL